MNNLIGKLIRWIGHISEIGGLILTWDFRKMPLGGSSPLRTGPKLDVIVELPPGSNVKPIRKFKVPASFTVEQMIDQLANYFHVDKGWELYGSKGEYRSQILNKNTRIDQYSSDKNARLYFYPKLRL
jgi:hypothetical protein